MMIRNGFTLIELLITTAILSIVLAAMTIALMQQQRQFNLTREVSDVDQTGRTALDLIASEIRNAASRQGKTFSINFFNGGSPNCNTNTPDSGTVDSPPDCITIRTWDIVRGMERGDVGSPEEGTTTINSTFAPVIVANPTSNLVLTIPDQWIDEDTGFLLDEDSTVVGSILIGVRSRTALCNSDSSVDCSADPEKCSECSALLSTVVNSSTKTATVSTFNDVKDHNFPTDFSSNLQTFIDGTLVGSVNYGFLPSIANLPSEMTLVTSRTFRIDPVNRQLERTSDDSGAFQPIVGGLDAPGVVDLQFVFTIQDEDGEVMKVGLPQNSSNNIFRDFSQVPTASAKDVKDVREIEIYIVVKSKIKPHKLSGGLYEQTIPAIADVSQKSVTNQSALPVEPEEGFVYRIFTTTIYPRNLGREDFG